MERNDYFTVTHFPESMREALAYLGRVSGRDEDKVAGAGLTAEFTELGNPIYAEADLAMTSLFGGFPGTFYAAYREVLPPAPGSGDRRDLYNLYHLLNHLNLFGEGYYDEVLGVLGRFVR